MIDAGLIERTRSINIADMVRARGLQLVGKANLAGACPRCGGRDRFAINVPKQLFNCRGCGGKGQGAIDLLVWLDGVGFKDAVDQLNDGKPAAVDNSDYANRNMRFHEAVRTADEEASIAFALHIWEQARPLPGTPAATYLRSRGIDPRAASMRLHEVLRWHPQCPWGAGRAPCLVALWTDIRTDEPRAIHRRPISADGEKLDVWHALAPTSGCVIRLWPDDEVTQGLVIGEGVETVLTAATRFHLHGTLLQPAWACGDADHLKKFPALPPDIETGIEPVLPGIEALTIIADNDEKLTGQKAAERCAERWRGAGREVTILLSQAANTDLADLVVLPW